MTAPTWCEHCNDAPACDACSVDCSPWCCRCAASAEADSAVRKALADHERRGGAR